MPIFLAQALVEYGGMSALAEGLSQLSFRLTDAVGDRGLEVIAAVVVAGFLWKVLTAAR
jgi:hypothetical protein